MIQTGGVFILLSVKRRAYFCKSIAIEMGGVSRYFSRVSGSGVDSTLLNTVTSRAIRVAFWYGGLFVHDLFQFEGRACSWFFYGLLQVEFLVEQVYGRF